MEEVIIVERVKAPVDVKLRTRKRIPRKRDTPRRGFPTVPVFMVLVVLWVWRMMLYN